MKIKITEKKEETKEVEVEFPRYGYTEFDVDDGRGNVEHVWKVSGEGASLKPNYVEITSSRYGCHQEKFEIEVNWVTLDANTLGLKCNQEQGKAWFEQAWQSAYETLMKVKPDAQIKDV